LTAPDGAIPAEFLSSWLLTFNNQGGCMANRSTAGKRYERDQRETGRDGRAASGETRPRSKGGSVAPDRQRPTQEQIRARAFELYQARGGTDGQELDDWRQAEDELGGGEAGSVSE
jgi:hypothetical protein